MVKIPASDYIFKVQGIEIEGFNDVGVDVQYPWEDAARRFHEHRMHDRCVLHGQISGDECSVQEIPGRHPLSSSRRL